MELTINKLAVLAGVTTRTLRYYDELGILKPARINSSKYRIYEQSEIDRLQQIMFYRELGVSLEDIKDMITSPDYDSNKTLENHKNGLIARRNQLELLIANVEKTLAESKGGTKMSNKEKFEGFKQKMIEENEAKYGDEVREKYGEDVYKKSQQKFANMTEEDHAMVTKLADDIQETLGEAFKTGDPASEIAQKACEIHKEWLCFYWPDGHYSKEGHYGLGEMYVADERFRAYYDKIAPGVSEFFRDALKIYTGM